jgi:GT2 family glycosyltransferase
LESIAVSVVPETVEWEVLVVDNNSKDQTRAVVEDFQRRYPRRFRYFFESRQGKSHALNSGIREAYGNILAFVDDDVCVEPAWLHNLTSPLHDGEWAGSGGRILPPLGFIPPEWLMIAGPHGMGGVVFAHFDLGDEAKPLDQAPYGTNMAFRRAVFEKYGGFRVDMGPCPGSEIRNEDTEFGRRLIAGGERMFYVPSAVVYHEAPEHRLKKEFFLRWWYDFGRGQIREGGVRPKFHGIPRHYISLPNNIFRVLPVETLRWLLAVNPKNRFVYKCRVWAVAGLIAEIWRQSFPVRETSKASSAGSALR